MFILFLMFITLVVSALQIGMFDDLIRRWMQQKRVFALRNERKEREK